MHTAPVLGLANRNEPSNPNIASPSSDFWGKLAASGLTSASSTFPLYYTVIGSGPAAEPGKVAAGLGSDSFRDHSSSKFTRLRA